LINNLYIEHHTCIKREAERERERERERGKGQQEAWREWKRVSSPLRFCNSCVCCAQIIPLGPFAVSPLRTFDRTRKPRSRRNSFANQFAKHVTESGDEIPSNAARAHRCGARAALAGVVNSTLSLR